MWRGAMPMLDPGTGVLDVPDDEVAHPLSAFLRAAHAFHDDQELAARMAVPIGVCAGLRPCARHRLAGNHSGWNSPHLGLPGVLRRTLFTRTASGSRRNRR